MAKSGQKRKRADKAKVQLKKKKQADIKLPKGQNVTRAEVKTKTIVVQSQVKKEELDPAVASVLTKKKLGLKDVLAKITNLSISTRVDGLEGLMELVQAGSSDILESQSSLILSRLLPILTEREGKLRNPAIKILQAIFRTSGQWLEPLYQVVSVHLCCALSHIEINVQFGALRFLDTLIENAPELVRRHSNQILPNCFNQIASVSAATSGSSSTGKLDSSLSDTVSSVQRRSEVISRIAKLLKILAQNDSPADTDNGNVAIQAVAFNEHGSNHFSLHQQPVNDLQTVSLAASKDRSNQFERFISGITPVLLEVWKECAGDGGKKPKKMATSWSMVDHVDLMCHITEALALICQITSSSNISDGSPHSSNSRIMSEVIAKWFPVDSSKSPEDAISINMNLCALYLTIKSSHGESEEIGTQMVNYVRKLLQTNVAAFKKHARVCTKVALALDKDHLLIDAGLLCVANSEVDDYVCSLIKDSRGKECPPILVAHLAQGIMSKWAGEKHCDALLHLAKTKDKHLTDKIVSALNDSKRDLSNISREDVCRALAVALRGASSEAKLKMSKHFQTLQMHDHSMAFCINTMAS